MAHLQKIGTMCLSLLLVPVLQLAPAAGTPVEELAKRLPDNTLGFVATSGGDALKGDFDKSSLGRICNDPNVRTFAAAVWTQVQAKAPARAADANTVKTALTELSAVSVFGARPMMFGVAQVEAKDGAPVCAFAIIDAGQRKAQLAETMTRLESQLRDRKAEDVEVASVKMRGIREGNDVAVYWGFVGDYLVAGAHDARGAALQYVAKPRTTVPEYFQKVPGTDDALAGHVDLQKIKQLLGAVAAAEHRDADANNIRKALTQLGLDKVAGVTTRAGFSGPDMVLDKFVEAPEPRTGLLAAFKPVDLSLLGLVDANAVTASTLNADVGSIYDTIVDTIKAVSPDEGYPQFQKGLTAVESEIKVNIRRDLLGSLAGPVVFYTLPAGRMVEAPMGGFAGVLKLKDGPLFEKTMVTLGKYIAAQSKGSLQISDQNDGGRVTHIWSSPALSLVQIMPTWSVIGDNVVIGSNTAVHQIEAAYVKAGVKRPNSLLNNDGYKKIAAQLPRNVVSFTYVDSQAEFRQTLIGVQQFWPMAVMLATQAGVALPVVLPNLDAVARQMQPGTRYDYFAADGLHVHYQGTGIEAALGGVAGGAIGAAVALPALVRVRDQAKSTSSAAHLKQIGLTLLMSADKNGGRLPQTLDELSSFGVNATTLKSPRAPKDFKGPGYIYIAGQTAAASPQNIVVYENPEYCTDGVNVLFLDGHVQFLKPDEFRAQLAETYRRLGREMPAIQFKNEIGASRPLRQAGKP